MEKKQVKNKLLKLVSFLLSLASLVSCFAVFSFAAESEAEGEETVESNIHVVYNRDYDDGWDMYNGAYVNNDAKHIHSIAREELTDGSLNHFVQIESTNDSSSYMQLSYDVQPASGGSILEFDIKIDDYCNLDNVLYMRTPGGASAGIVGHLCAIKDNRLILFMDYDVGIIDQGWVHLGYVMNFDQNEYVCRDCKALQIKDPKLTLKDNDGVLCDECGSDYVFHRIKFRVYFSLSEHFDPEQAIDGNNLSGKLTSADLTSTYYMDYIFEMGDINRPSSWQVARIDFFRFGPGLGSRTDAAGQKIQFDNVKIYSDTTVENGQFMSFNDLKGMGYGSNVNEFTTPTVDLGGGNSISNVVKRGIVMKTNSNYLLTNDTKEAIYLDSDSGYAYGAPRKIDGQVYIPFEPILNITGYPFMWHADGISCDISTADGSSVLTIGRDSAVINGVRTQLTAEPQYLKAEKSDDLYPVIALEDVELFFPGWYVSYDTMGLICICERENVFDRTNDLATMLTYMKKFVFDYYTGEQFYDAVKEHTNNFDHPYIMADQEQMDYIYAVYTGEIENEKMLSWIDYFMYRGNNVYNVYTTQPVDDKNGIVAKEYNAKGEIVSWAEKDEDYELLWYELSNYLENGINHGKWVDTKYDYGQYPVLKNGEEAKPYGYVGQHYNDGAEIEQGRCDGIQGLASEIEDVAVAYVITRDLKYAQLCWEMCLSFMKLRHWGHHTFLVVSEVGHVLAMVYDWLYDVWTDEFNYDTNMLVQAMYEKIIWFGYVVTVDKDTTDWYEEYSNQPGTTRYNDMTINWNAVCTSGLTMCELAIIGAEDKNGVDFKKGSDYKGNIYTEIDFTYTKGHFDNVDGLNLLYYIMESNFITLCELGLDQYPPDGSFIESPSYWGYATNNLVDMIWSLTTALGDDLGLLDFGGMDTTWYFPVYTEYPSDQKVGYKYSYWAYHDSSNGLDDTAFPFTQTDSFFFIADAIGDYSLAAYRLQQVENGKGCSIRDLMGYKPEYAELTENDVQLEKEYIMENLEGITTRSNWEEGALFTGIMGDANNCTAHGQIDCGNWIYANLNYTWIVDMGCDEYDLYGYFTNPTRYLYYRNTAEGNNTFIITSRPDDMPNGQFSGGKAPLQKDMFISNEYGSKAILDGTALFPSLANNYFRGLLLTNDRTTVVIQDQVGFKASQDVAWIAHTRVENITLSEDGRTAYLTHQMTDHTERIVRLSIVEERNTDLKFEILDAGINNYLLENTHRYNFSTDNGGEPEYSRKPYKRLVIRDYGTLSFNVAVVVELLDIDESLTSAVEYDYQDMRNWVPQKEYTGLNSDTGLGGSDGKEETIGSLKPADIVNNANQCKMLIDSKYAFSTRTTDFFKCLARVNTGFNSLNIDRYQGVESMQTAYRNYKEYMKLYSAFKDDVNAKLYRDIALTRSFSGV